MNVVFERLSEYLRLELAEFKAECAGDVVECFEGNRAEQERRTERRCQLDAAGATGRIDSVVVNAVREAGHDIAEVLKKLAMTDERIIDVGDSDEARKEFQVGRRDGDEKLFRLHWKNGDVYADISLEDGVSWHEGTLSFREAPVSITKAKGRRVRDIVDNPILGDVRITSGFGKKGGYARFGCTQDLLHFDAETGRLWAA